MGSPSFNLGQWQMYKWSFLYYHLIFTDKVSLGKSQSRHNLHKGYPSINVADKSRHHFCDLAVPAIGFWSANWILVTWQKWWRYLFSHFIMETFSPIRYREVETSRWKYNTPTHFFYKLCMWNKLIYEDLT